MRILWLLICCFSLYCGPLEAGPPLVPAWNAEHRLLYLDSRGAVALETDYRQGDFFDDGRARVCGERCGFINESGDALFGFEYYRLDSPSEGRIGFCKEEGKCGFLDLKGNVILEPVWEDVGAFSQGLAAARRDGKWGFIDGKGAWKIAPAYGSVLHFSEGLASVQSAEAPYLFGIINTSGRVVLKFSHQKIFPYSGGLALFFHWDRFGYLDRQGQMVLTAQLEWAQNPVSGLSYFVHQNSQGYRKGRTVAFSLDCPGGTSFASEPPVVARVQDCESGLFKYVDGSGKEWKGSFVEATEFRHGFAIVRRWKEDHYRLLDDSGEEHELRSDILPAW